MLQWNLVNSSSQGATNPCSHKNAVKSGVVKLKPEILFGTVKLVVKIVNFKRTNYSLKLFHPYLSICENRINFRNVSNRLLLPVTTRFFFVHTKAPPKGIHYNDHE
jgi:hypothetical protein